MKKRKPLIFIFFLLLNFLPQVFVIISKSDNLMNWYLTDDAFYYFKTAQNIAEGNGITFDGINLTNGFHPLWMMICIPIFALAKVDLFLPLRLVVVVQILLNAASGFLLFNIISEKISKPTAWIASIFWMFYPPIHGITTKLGLETGLTAFMIILFFYLISKLSGQNDERSYQKQLLQIGFCGVGVLFSRLDNIFILMLVGIWLVFRGKTISKKSQIDFLLILLSAVASFFIRLNSYENIFNFIDFLYGLIASALVIKPTLLYFFHAYESEKNKNGLFLFKKVILPLSISNALIFGFLFITHDMLNLFSGFPRSAILVDLAISLILIGAHHYYWHRKTSQHVTHYEDLAIKNNWRTWGGRALRYFSPIVILLIAYLGFNYQYAGTAMPISGQIKRWWGTLPNSVYGRPIKTLIGVFNGMIDPSRAEGPYWMVTRPIAAIANFLKGIFGLPLGGKTGMDLIFFLCVAVFFVFLAVKMLTHDREKYQQVLENLAVLPFFVGTFFHGMLYKSTGYLHMRDWYWVGELLLIVLVLSVLLDAFTEITIKKWLPKKILIIIAVIICGFVWGKFSLSIIHQFPLDGNVPVEYDLAGDAQFMHANTEPGDVIGMTGGGLNAYFIPDRTFINLDGLINSVDYFQKLKSGSTTDFLVANKVKYVLGSEVVLLDSDPYRWVFTDALTVKVPGEYYQFYSYDPVFGQ